jgi:transposase
MFRFDAPLKVYVHREAVDFRKSINGLVALVEQALGLDPFAPALYVGFAGLGCLAGAVPRLRRTLST